jgi:hypothetical protein
MPCVYTHITMSATSLHSFRFNALNITYVRSRKIFIYFREKNVFNQSSTHNMTYTIPCLQKTNWSKKIAVTSWKLEFPKQLATPSAIALPPNWRLHDLQLFINTVEKKYLKSYSPN